MTDDSTNRTIKEHLEENVSPATLKTLRRARWANNSRSLNPASADVLWTNTEGPITSNQKPQSYYTGRQPPPPQQKQQTRE